VIHTTGNGNGNGNDNGNDNGNNGNGKGHGKPTEIVIERAGSSNADLRTLPDSKPDKKERPERAEPQLNPILLEPSIDTESGLTSKSVSGFTRLVPGVNAQAPSTLMNFDGLDFQNWGAGHPPDTNGDVGRDYYIQTINTSIGIYRKS